MKMRSLQYTFLLIFIPCCNAGFFSNLQSFILDRLGRRFTRRQRSHEPFSVSDIEIARPSSAEVILTLTEKNQLLRAQVLSLKTFVNMQKKLLLDAKKEKDALRKSTISLAQRLHKERELDQESIKNELRNGFENEKIIMIKSFEQEKDLLREDHSVGMDNLKSQLTVQLEKKSEELDNFRKENSKQTVIINDFEKSNKETVQDIAELKKALRAKEIAMTEYRESVKAAEEAKEKGASEIARTTKLANTSESGKKIVDSARPTRPSKTSSVSKTSSTPKSSTPGSSRNRPPMANGQSISPAPRGGL